MATSKMLSTQPFDLKQNIKYKIHRKTTETIFLLNKFIYLLEIFYDKIMIYVLF